MRQWILPLAFMLLVAASPKSPWPDTPAGSMARQWVEAFSSEQAMRAFLVRNVDDESFRKRPLDERLAAWRESKKKLGTLKLVSIESSKPEELKVILAAGNGEKYPFTFTVQSSPPHKLVSITRTETERRGHGFGLLPGH